MTSNIGQHSEMINNGFDPRLGENELELSKRINDNITRAMSQENPLCSLGGFCRVNVPKREITECDDNTIDSGNSNTNDKSSSCEGIISFFKSPLPKEIEKQCIKLFERNMGTYYKSSSWGLNLKAKRKELRHPDARFLVLIEKRSPMKSEDNYNGEIGSSCQVSNEIVVAFSHFRFEVNDDDYPTEEVLYVYELQVNPTVRGRGLGKKFMIIMELLAIKSKMRKVVLTVFKNNTKAMNFYLKRMNYDIDDFSPSNYVNDDADYEILSKRVHRERN